MVNINALGDGDGVISDCSNGFYISSVNSLQKRTFLFLYYVMSMLENILIALGGKMTIKSTLLGGLGEGLKIGLGQLGNTLQKFVANLFFVKKILIAFFLFSCFSLYGKKFNIFQKCQQGKPVILPVIGWFSLKGRHCKLKQICYNCTKNNPE